MTFPEPTAILRTGLMIAMLATGSAGHAEQAPVGRQDTALAYAQCVRDHGYAEFPDPEPDGFRFLIAPEDVSRFKAAAEACRDIAPEGMRDEKVTPERLEALRDVSQCVRENGVADFPDPDAKGGLDFDRSVAKPGAPRFEAAMTACRDAIERAGGIAIGG